MNEKLIKQALNDLADQAIPTDFDPSPVIRQRIETALRSQGHHPEKPKRQLRLSLAGLSALFVILLGAAFLFTPQGRAAAQDVIRFFTFAPSDVLPLPTGQPTEPPHLTRTAAPTLMVGLQEVTPATSASNALNFPTATPAPTGESVQPVWNLTIDQAEQLAGYPIRVPFSLPPGYRLDNVIFDPQTLAVSQFYGFHPYSAGEQFILHQLPSGFADVIGRSAVVEQITVGGNAVEFVAGTWLAEVGATSETWQSDSIYHTFRWQEDDFYFALEILFDDADTWSPAYWTEDGMLAMMELVMGIRITFPEQINLNNLTSIDQAQQAAGFDIQVPSLVPEGFIFTRAVYEPETDRILMFYQPEDGSRTSTGVRLLVIQKLRTDQPAETWESFPQGAVEAVMVDASQATFIRGTMADGVYSPEPDLRLVWNTTDLSIELLWSSRLDHPARLDKEELIAIAESMQ